MRKIEYYQVDSFTNEPFMGNPAGVCIIDYPLEDTLMQNIAMEMNISETAFIVRNKDIFNIRWFSPKEEVNLCGHATLAAAHILINELNLCSSVTFDSQSGPLPVFKERDKLVMDFPQIIAEDVECPNIVKEALQISPVYTGRTYRRYVLAVENEQEVLNLSPNIELLKKADRASFVITAKSERPGYDFISRNFVPSTGVNEDPVTGSSHCTLAPYWHKKLNKKKLIGYQASARSGFVECELTENNRIKLKGEAVTVFRGMLYI
jgi:PhzF family phenazine biosynthesis protein